MCIISLIPASSSAWKKVMEPKKTKDMDEMAHSTKTELSTFPWSEFLTLIGFTTIFVIEIFQSSQNKTGRSDSTKNNNPAGTELNIFIRQRNYTCNTFVSINPIF